MTERLRVGIPVLNRGDLLERLIRSIDVPAEALVIVNRIGPVEPDLVRALDSLQERPPPAVRLVVEWIEGNLGVSGSWNRILDWADGECLVCNSDIEFSPGALAEALGEMAARSEAVIYHLLAAACFYVSADFRQRLGWFDENFYPAYREDQEMALRAGALGVRRKFWEMSEGKITHHGSQSRLSSSDAVRKFIAQANRVGGEYFERRWGSLPPPGHNVPSRRFPFDDPGREPSDWTLDLTARERIAQLCRDLTGFECPLVFHRSEGGLCS